MKWLDPRIVVALGGSYWRDAAAAAPGLAGLPRPLMASGDVDGRRWVVGWHPNGANCRGWVLSRYVPLIVDATTR